MAPYFPRRLDKTHAKGSGAGPYAPHRSDHTGAVSSAIFGHPELHHAIAPAVVRVGHERGYVEPQRYRSRRCAARVHVGTQSARVRRAKDRRHVAKGRPEILRYREALPLPAPAGHARGRVMVGACPRRLPRDDDPAPEGQHWSRW
jgi:hypothetical protein